MTIKIEREALLYVLQSSSKSLRYAPQHLNDEEDEWVEVSVDKDFQEQVDIGDDSSIACSDDESSTESREDRDRRVSFSDSLVTEIHTRPRTPPADVSKLFYSAEQTQRFRQEYRMERKLMMELDVDLEKNEADLSDLFDDSPCLELSSSHHISKVLILHNDKIETLSDCTNAQNLTPQDDAAIFDNESFWSGSITWF